MILISVFLFRRWSESERDISNLFTANMAEHGKHANDRLTHITNFLTGNKIASTIPFDPNCTNFPARRDVPQRDDAPEGA